MSRSEGYDSEYDRDEYSRMEYEERHPDLTWKVCGEVKVRIVQNRPRTEQDDVDTAVWIRFGWTHVGTDDELTDEVKEAIVDTLGAEGHFENLFDTVPDVGDIVDAALDWEVVD